MVKFLASPVAQPIVWSAVLAVLLVCAYYVVLKFRDRAVGDETSASDLLSNFRELHERGALSETEYRTIKTRLGSKLQDELKRAGEKDSQQPNEPTAGQG